MKRVIITVGLGFGDEGKGATVDYLTRRHEADLVVRYCGGSQAGHNVQLPDGRRHTFSQFGAGTLARASSRSRTYLGPNVVIDPPAMLREAEHLAELGVSNPTSLLTIHPRCLVATLWHRALNQLREMARGEDKHGSCGQGDRRGPPLLAAAWRGRHLRGGPPRPGRPARQTRTPAPAGLAGNARPRRRIDSDRLRAFDLWDVTTEAVARSLSETVRNGVVVSSRVPECETAIFEGAQGVLLDEYRGFHPYTTWSTVTPHHAWELVEQMEAESVALLGVTRAYTTRHGEGPFPTCSAELTARLQDPGNPWNAWQGGLRCGWLDMPLFRYGVAAAGPLDGIVVNHLDQIRESECLVCDAYEEGALVESNAPNLAWQNRQTQQLQRAKPVFSPADAESILRRLAEAAPVVVTGSGTPTRSDTPPGCGSAVAGASSTNPANKIVRSAPFSRVSEKRAPPQATTAPRVLRTAAKRGGTIA